MQLKIDTEVNQYVTNLNRFSRNTESGARNYQRHARYRLLYVLIKTCYCFFNL